MGKEIEGLLPFVLELEHETPAKKFDFKLEYLRVIEKLLGDNYHEVNII